MERIRQLAFIILTGILLNLIINVNSKSFNRLSDLIRHYEPVHYDKDSFHDNHLRVRRSVTESNDLRVNVFGRDLNLVMFRDHDAMAHDVVITTVKGPVQYDGERAYKGHVDGVDGSTVYGIVTPERTFEGRVNVGDEIYNIERASKYFKNKQTDFHTLVYRNSDLEPHKIQGDSICPTEKLFEKQKQMKNEKRKRAPKVEIFTKESINAAFKADHADEGGEKYRAPNDEREQPNDGRKKRAIDDTKQQCTLYMEADVSYYEYWDSDEISVIDEFLQHVQGVNDIYELVDFDEDAAGAADGINFIIKKIHIWTDEDDNGYKFPGSWGVEAFLTEFSTDEDWDNFCLVYIFNHRDFDGGTLGLAWTGDPDSDGGVCEESGTYNRVDMSLNAGLVTVLNYGNFVPRALSILTFAHELGHNMGSPHDRDSSNRCAPGGNAGNYIMYAHATDGDKRNNDQFSSCSIDSMHTVMRTDARDEDNGCFRASAASICGNRVIEGAEECDCGTDSQCDDVCCDASTCTLAPGANCSPASHTCCEANCSFTAAHPVVECREARNCKAAAYCDGGNGTCPESDHAANGTYCYDAQLVCVSGECVGSLCLRVDMVQCQCPNGDWNKKKACQLCCAPDDDADNCQSSFELDAMNGTHALSGTPCKNYKGYCDSLNKCKKYNPDSSFQALQDLFSSEGLQSLQLWLKRRWYIPVSATVGFIILMVLLIKFGVPKKKSDKKKKKKENDEKKKEKDEKKKNKVGPSLQKRGPPPRQKQAFSPPPKY